MANAKEILESNLTPAILYEDEEILVLNKPAGLMVHGDGRSKEETMADWLAQKYPDLKEVGEKLTLQSGEEILRSGIVHRLDRWTSGVIIAAKTQRAFLRLKTQFQNREIKKTYVALVYGKVRDDFGTINLPIGRSKGDYRQHTAPLKPRGEMREAQTYFEVMARAGEGADSVTYLKVLPKTGRTHQIRVHLKAIGHPVICDRVYGKEKPCILGFGRTALHAREIIFQNMAGEETKLQAPLPDDFLVALKELKISV